MRSTKRNSLAFVLTMTAAIACAMSLMLYALYSWAFMRGYLAARVTCPDVQQGERLRYVEQPFDERIAICVYGQAYAVVSVKRKAK